MVIGRRLGMASSSGTTSLVQMTANTSGRVPGMRSAAFCEGSLGSRSIRRAERSLKPALAAAMACVCVCRNCM